MLRATEIIIQVVAKEVIVVVRRTQDKFSGAIETAMKRNDHEILILMRHHSLPESAIEKEMERVNKMLSIVETPDNFCIAHELVNRNYITQTQKKILKAIKYLELKPFRFLISKN